MSTINAYTNTFLAKYDSKGTCLWVKPVNGALTIYGNAVTVDGRGSILMTGKFGGDCFFDKLFVKGSGLVIAKISDGVLSVEDGDKPIAETPITFGLKPNYPNPFNPSTTISLSLPSRTLVTLKIFDVMGREVSTVVSAELPAGSYTRQWTAVGLSSGVYFYRVQAGAIAETYRLPLIKNSISCS